MTATENVHEMQISRSTHALFVLMAEPTSESQVKILYVPNIDASTLETLWITYNTNKSFNPTFPGMLLAKDNPWNSVSVLTYDGDKVVQIV